MAKKDSNIIFGFHSITEAIKANKTIDKVLIKKNLKSNLFQECFSLIRQYGIPFQYVPQEKLNRITRANHQGIIALVSAVEYQDIEQLLPMIYEEGKEPFILILDGITDVRNFGAIARTAVSAGVDAIITSKKNSALINSDAIKTSSGALNTLPVCRVNNLSETISFLQQSGLTIYGASEKSESYYFSNPIQSPVGIVMGAEDKGLSPEVLKKVDYLVKIPMIGNMDSLNVSVACGILLYEVVRLKIIETSSN